MQIHDKLTSGISIIDKLMEFDEALLSLDLKFKLKLTLVGSAPLILRHGDSLNNRYTLDIDTVTRLPILLVQLATEFDINNDALSVCEMPPGFETRTTTLKTSFTNLEVDLISDVDLILLKLQRYSEKDEVDIDFLLNSLSADDRIILEQLGDIMSEYLSPFFRENWNYVRRRI